MASSLIVAETARIIKDQAVPELVGDLVAAFDRLMIDPEKTDKQCRAKIEIVDALNRFEYGEPDMFLRGLTHRQDRRFSEPPGQDAAGALRAFCAFGLARIGHPSVVLLLTELLLDSDDTARAGAARALGNTGSLAAIPLLRYKVRIGDRLADVIGECFTSLLTLSFEESLPFVAPYLRTKESCAARSCRVRPGRDTPAGSSCCPEGLLAEGAGRPPRIAAGCPGHVPCAGRE